MSQGKTKREFDRHSGTGHPIKGEVKRQGGGKHNWGNDSELVSEEIDKLHHETTTETTNVTKKNNDPETLADLNESNDKAENKNKSIDDFFAERGLKKTDPYNVSQVKKTAFTYADDQANAQNQEYGGGRGRGRGRGQGQNYGGRGRGDNNAYENNPNSNFRGNFRGGRGGGFGGRGRGRTNYDNLNSNDNNNNDNNNFNDNNNNNNLSQQQQQQGGGQFNNDNNMNYNNDNMNMNNNENNNNQNNYNNMQQVPSQQRRSMQYRKKQPDNNMNDQVTNQVPVQEQAAS